jgi:hypothetical protein
MNKKLAWAALFAVLASGCSSTPRWDSAVFPNQVYYDGSSVPAQVAAEQKK